MNKIIVMLGFAILLPLLGFTGYFSINSAPKVQDFVRIVPLDPNYKPTPEERAARNTEVQQQQHQFGIALQKFATIFIFIMTGIGTVEIVGGAHIRFPEISSGLIIAGMLTILCGNMVYWANLPVILHFASLLMGFLGILLVWVRLIQRSEKSAPS